MKKSIIALVIVVFLTISGVVAAQNTGKQHILSSKEISQLALSYVKGKIDHIELNDKKSNPVYVVNIKNKKAKYNLQFDAKTGELLEKSTEYSTSSKTTKEMISLSKAKKIALKTIKGKILKSKLDKVNGLYKIQIAKGKHLYEIKIDAYTGEMIKKKKLTNLKANQAISLKNAKRIALNNMNGVVKQVRYNRDGGLYEIHVVKNKIAYKFDIDAYSGEIIQRQSSDLATADSGDVIGLEQAKQIALNAVGGSVTEASLDNNGMYKIKLQNNEEVYNVEINAQTGAIIKQEKESAKRTFASFGDEVIGIEKAKEIALTKVSGQVTSANYDQTNNVYEIIVASNGNEYDILLNAQTGAVMKQEQKEKENTVSNNNSDSTLITPEQASQIALTKAKGTVTKIDLVNSIYEVEVKDGTYLYAIKIDANTGAVLNMDKDYETKG